MTAQVSTLEITTMAQCSVRCTICPQNALAAAYKGRHRLTIDGFHQALLNTPKHVRIHFSGFVEPWLNSECTTMLSLALEKGFRVGVWTTCVGMKDWARVANLLLCFKAHVETVCVHLADGVYMATSQAASDTRGSFIHALQAGGITPELYSMRDTSTHVDRAGLVQIGKAPVRHTGPIKCSYSDDYSHNVILPNGDVHLCCMDYGLKHKLGNLFEQTWPELRTHVIDDIAIRNHTQTDTICRKCHGAVPA